MRWDGTQFASSALGALSETDTRVLVAFAGFALLAAVVVAMLLYRLLRQRVLRETRDVVAAVEALRSGQPRERRRVDPQSPLILVFDAIQRLENDLVAMTGESKARSEKARALMEAVSDHAVVTTDADGDVRTFSEGAHSLFGWEPSEVVSRSASILFEGESYKEFLPLLARRELRQRGVTARTRLQRRDGSGFPADVSVRLLRGEGVDAVGFLMLIREVSQQVQLENRLRESEQRYRGLVEELTEGVLIVRDGRLLYVNPAFAELCGLPAEQLIGTPLRDCISTRDVLMVEERLTALEAEPGATDEMVCGLGAPDEAPLTSVRLKGTSLDYDGGRAVLLVVHDETAGRRLEAELRRNESQLDAVLEATSDGILVLVEGKQGARVHMCNGAFAELFGLGQEDTLGLGERELMRMLRKRGEGAASVAGFIASAGYERATEAFTFGGLHQGEVEVSLAPLVARSGKLLGRVVACRDLTARRDSERKLQLHAEQLQLSKVRLEQAYRRLDEANGELRARTDELDRLNTELHNLDEMKSNLLANVSHDLQTPLVAIRGYTEMILKGRLGAVTEEQRKGLSLSLSNIDRLISMIDNLLVFSRSAAEMGRLQLSEFPLRPLVEETTELLVEKMRARGIVLESKLVDDLTVHADRDKVQQVFINLVSNAIKFNRDRGRISISATGGRPGFVEVTVADTGLGIPDDALARVFDRHFQVPRDAAHSTEGSGIGLAIVRDILRAHGCRIDVASQEGRGSRFRFTLPAAGEAMGRTETEAADAAPGPADPVGDARPQAAEPRQADEVDPAAEAPSVEPPREPPAGEPPSVEPPRRGDAEGGPGRRPRFRIIRRDGGSNS